MKVFKILLVTLILGATMAGLFGCGSNSDEQTPATQIASVKRGNLTLEITAAGNLALSHTEDLAVELFYPTGTKGTIGEVLVDEGDSVKEGQVLVTLDTTEWDKQLTIVQRALDTARRNVTTKSGLVTDAERQVTTLQRTVTTKEILVTKAERQITIKEIAVRQAEIAVQSANSTLNQITDVQEAKDVLDDATTNLDVIKKLITGYYGGGLGGALNTTDNFYWANLKSLAQQDVTAAQEDYADILDGTSVHVTSDVALQVTQSKLALEQSRMAVYDAQTAVDDARYAVEDARIAVDTARYAVTTAQQALANARMDLENAQSTLEDSQKDLDEAKSLSPEIKAPFDGFVTLVNVAGGDEVLNGTIAVQVADPDKFEANILVSEMDIPQVKLDGEATVQVSAMSGTTLPAKVTHIAPTATIQSGVVNYAVKVELEALPAVSQNQTTAQPAATENATVELPPMLQRAVEAGRMTQQQAEDFVKNGPPADFRPPEGFTPPEGFSPPEGFTLPEGVTLPGLSGSRAQSQLPSTSSSLSNIQLRQGLTVTVSIIVANRTSVLLVPNGAVTKEGGQSVVQVVTASGTTEKRAVQTGLSDWQNTEITSGLSDGENIVVPKASASASTTTQSNQPRGGIPFLGR